MIVNILYKKPMKWLYKIKCKFLYNTKRRQKKWTEIALAQFEKGEENSWGGDILEESRLGDYKKILNTYLLPNASGKNCLELGCLDGRWSQYLIPVSHHTTLIDLSADISPLLQKKFQKHANKFTFYETRGDELDQVKSDSIDLIFTIDTLVRVSKKNIESYLKEFRRVLKKDGKMLIHLPCTASDFSKNKGFTSLSISWIAKKMIQCHFNVMKFDFDTIKHGVLIHYGF